MENKIKIKKPRINIGNSCNGRGCRIYILPKDKEVIKIKMKMVA
jgi:hypothetical protein